MCWCHERLLGITGERQLQVAERQLRCVGKRRFELPRLLVEVHHTDELDIDSIRRSGDEQLDFRRVGPQQVDIPFERRFGRGFDQGRLDRDGA